MGAVIPEANDLEGFDTGLHLEIAFGYRASAHFAVEGSVGRFSMTGTTGYLTGSGSDPTREPLVDNGAGVLPGMEFHFDSHTNALVPLFAKGDAARLFSWYADQHDPVRDPYVDNTEIAKVVFEAMTGLE